MPSFNRVILIGRLTRDPELRYTAGGLAVTKFAIAVDRRFKNPQGERVTDFFDCSAFRQTAEFVSNYVSKGRLVAVDGRIEMNDVTGADGQKRRYTNIICDTVETLDSARDGAGGEGDMGHASAAPPQQAAPPADDYYPEEESAPRAAAPARAAAPKAAPAAANGSARPAAASAASRPAPASAAPAARPAPAPARAPQPAYPEDDFDDSDPFADE